MQSTAFRIISTAVTLLLLLALVLALLLVIYSNPNTANPLPLTSATLNAASATGKAATAVAVAPSQTPTVFPSPTLSPTAPATATASLVESVAAPVTSTVTSTITATITASATPTSTFALTDAVLALETTSSGPQIFSNPNAANGVAVVDGTLWVATDGGVVARNLTTGRTTNFTTLDGLRSHVVNSVVNCQMAGLGVVFGSGAGLQIFGEDGRWRTLSPANSGMAASDVAALECVPEANALVVGYAQNGVDIFDTASGTWNHLDRNNGLASDNITTLAVALGFSALWIATDAGLTVLGNGPTDAQISVLTGQNSPLQSNSVGDIEITRDGSVWIGGEGILYQFRPPAEAGSGGAWTVYTSSAATIRTPLASAPVQPAGNFPSGFIQAIAPGANDTLWLGSTPRDLATGAVEVCRFDPATTRCLAYANLSEINLNGPNGVATTATQSLTGLAVASGDLYYTSDGGGVTHFDGEAWSPMALGENLLAGNAVRDVAQTVDGTLFVATEGGVQPIVGDAVGNTVGNVLAGSRGATALHGDASGGLWLGGDGVRYLPDASTPNEPDAVQSFSVADGLVANRVQALATDSSGRTWIGTDVGLSIWNGSSFFNLDASTGLPNENISALLADETGVWIGSAGGLFRFQDNRLQIFDLAQAGLPSSAVTALALEAPVDESTGGGALLVGTRSGAARLLGDDIEPLPVAVGERVTTLSTASDGSIVLGTVDGAWRFDGVDWSRLRPVDGLPSTNVSASLIATDGTLWIGGAEGGLARLGK